MKKKLNVYWFIRLNPVQKWCLMTEKIRQDGCGGFMRFMWKERSSTGHEMLQAAITWLSSKRGYAYWYNVAKKNK